MAAPCPLQLPLLPNTARPKPVLCLSTTSVSRVHARRRLRGICRCKHHCRAWLAIRAVAGRHHPCSPRVCASDIVAGVGRYLVLRGGRNETVSRLLGKISRDQTLEGAEFVDTAEVAGFPVKQLFRGDLLVGTLLLWVTFFMSLLVFYLLTSWLPTLWNSGGQSLKSSAMYALVLPIGSTVGAIAIGYLWTASTRVSSSPIAMCWRLASLQCWVIPLRCPRCCSWPFLGLGSVPVDLRSASTRWLRHFIRRGAARPVSVGLTRSGAPAPVVGSMIGGYFLSLGWDLTTVFAVAALPALIAALRWSSTVS